MGWEQRRDAVHDDICDAKAGILRNGIPHLDIPAGKLIGATPNKTRFGVLKSHPQDLLRLGLRTFRHACHNKKVPKESC